MRIITIVVLVILGLLLIGGCTVIVAAAEQVDPGQVCVVTRFGEPTGRVLHPGLSWINPFKGENTIAISTQPRTYETSEHPDTSKADFTDYWINSRTTDGQEVLTSYSVVFQIPNDDAVAICIVEEYSGSMKNVVERVVKPQSRSIGRLDTQQYRAEELFGGIKIFEYQAGVSNKLDEAFANTGCGLVLDSFLVRGIKFTDEYADTIEIQQQEEEKIKTAGFMADQKVEEARGVAAAAKGEADAKVIRAEADAQAVKIAADADAYATTVNAAAQAEANRLISQSLDNELLQYRFIDNLNAVDWGFLPAEGILPLLPLDVPTGE